MGKQQRVKRNIEQVTAARVPHNFISQTQTTNTQPRKPNPPKHNTHPTYPRAHKRQIQLYGLLMGFYTMELDDSDKLSQKAEILYRFLCMNKQASIQYLEEA